MHPAGLGAAAEESLVVAVKTLSGRRLSVAVTSRALVAEAKALVAEQEGLSSVADVKLVFHGRTLADGHALRDYGVNAGALLFMVPVAL